MTTTTQIEEVWALLEQLTDPEIPVITLRELGILREIRESAGGLEVIITPTYSGCPAMEQIEADVRGLLAEQGISAKVTTRLSPAWTTDWMTDEGKEK
ncbi:MAG: metal-sulfur cluster assembly factor, partial [Betaproteobacteria bacterium]